MPDTPDPDTIRPVPFAWLHPAFGGDPRMQVGPTERAQVPTKDVKPSALQRLENVLLSGERLSGTAIYRARTELGFGRIEEIEQEAREKEWGKWWTISPSQALGIAEFGEDKFELLRPSSWSLGGAARGTVAFAADVVLDPLTWVTFGAGGVAKIGAKPALKVAGMTVARKGGVRVGLRGTEEIAARVAGGVTRKVAGREMMERMAHDPTFHAEMMAGGEQMIRFGTRAHHIDLMRTARITEPIGAAWRAAPLYGTRSKGWDIANRWFGSRYYDFTQAMEKTGRYGAERMFQLHHRRQEIDIAQLTTRFRKVIKQTPEGRVDVVRQAMEDESIKLTAPEIAVRSELKAISDELFRAQRGAGLVKEEQYVEQYIRHQSTKELQEFFRAERMAKGRMYAEKDIPEYARKLWSAEHRTAEATIDELNTMFRARGVKKAYETDLYEITAGYARQHVQAMEFARLEKGLYGKYGERAIPAVGLRMTDAKIKEAKEALTRNINNERMEYVRKIGIAEHGVGVVREKELMRLSREVELARTGIETTTQLYREPTDISKLLEFASKEEPRIIGGYEKQLKKLREANERFVARDTPKYARTASHIDVMQRGKIADIEMVSPLEPLPLKEATRLATNRMQKDERARLIEKMLETPVPDDVLMKSTAPISHFSPKRAAERIKGLESTKTWIGTMSMVYRCEADRLAGALPKTGAPLDISHDMKVWLTAWELEGVQLSSKRFKQNVVEYTKAMEDMPELLGTVAYGKMRTKEIRRAGTLIDSGELQDAASALVSARSDKITNTAKRIRLLEESAAKNRDIVATFKNKREETIRLGKEREDILEQLIRTPPDTAQLNIDREIARSKLVQKIGIKENILKTKQYYDISEAHRVLSRAEEELVTQPKMLQLLEAKRHNLAKEQTKYMTWGLEAESRKAKLGIKTTATKERTLESTRVFDDEEFYLYKMATGEQVYFPQAVAGELRKPMRRYLTQPGTQFRGIEEKYIYAETQLKKSLTVLWPAFFARNVQGGMFQNYLEDVGAMDYYRSWDILMRTSDWKVARGFRNVMGITDAKTYDIPLMGEKSARQMREMWNQYGVSGTATGHMDVPLSEVQGREAAGAIGKLRNWVWNKYPETAMTGTEAMVRSPLFMHELYKGATAEAAELVVGKTHFRYGVHELTEFEALGMKRLMPFWTWARWNIRRQSEMVVRRPGKYATVFKAQERVVSEEERERMPDWMREKLGFTVGDTFVGVDLPIGEMPGLYGQEDVAFGLSPMIKYPIGALFGRELGTGRPVGGFTDIEFMFSSLLPRASYAKKEISKTAGGERPLSWTMAHQFGGVGVYEMRDAGTEDAYWTKIGRKPSWFPGEQEEYETWKHQEGWQTRLTEQGKFALSTQLGDVDIFGMPCEGQCISRHIVPVESGGTNDMSNMVLVHRSNIGRFEKYMQPMAIERSQNPTTLPIITAEDRYKFNIMNDDAMNDTMRSLN